MTPHIFANSLSPDFLEIPATRRCDTLVANSWNEVYIKLRYGSAPVPISKPSFIKYWVDISNCRISIRPDRYRYLFSKSPWRFSSAVHALTHFIHPPCSFFSTSSTMVNHDS